MSGEEMCEGVRLGREGGSGTMFLQSEPVSGRLHVWHVHCVVHLYVHLFVGGATIASCVRTMYI